MNGDKDLELVVKLIGFMVAVAGIVIVVKIACS
jgi:hypothetical protein